MSEPRKLKYLQPAQYESWLRKATDPDWDDDSRSKAERAATSMALELRDTIADLRAAQDRIKALEDFLVEYTGQSLEEIGQNMMDALAAAAELVIEGEDEPIVEQGLHGDRNVQ